MRATAVAGINIALIKYWGKRDPRLNLPAVGSIALTLDRPGTRTTVRFDVDRRGDSLELDGATVDPARIRPLLDAIRARAGIEAGAVVCSHNTVPTAAGLASSASGFAALATAAWAAAGLAPDPIGLAEVARLGSGSAPRSLLPGLVELDRDSGQPHSLGAEGWALRVVIARTQAGPKSVPSREGMDRCAQTSPYYPAWVASHPADLLQARRAIAARRLSELGEAMERSTLKMHACMMAARPPLLYLRGATLDGLEAVGALRARGIPAWFTVDAGPHVKVLCEAGSADRIAEAMRALPRVQEVIVAAPGLGARLEP